MQVTIAGVALSEGGNESPSNLKINGKRLTQTAEFLRGESVAMFGRGNHKTTISFQVCRVWPNISEAEDFMLTHETEIPDGGLVVFTSDPGTGGNVTRYLNAVVDDVSGTQIGVRTFHDYTLIGGLMLETAPT